MRRLGLALLALALAGCESTQEQSAKLKAHAKHVALATSDLRITRTSTQVAVLATATISGGEGAAVAVTLRNRTARALRDIPISIAVSNASGRTLYRNSSPGLEPALTSVPSLAAHQTLTWVDDQVPASVGAARTSARVGEASIAGGTLPRLRLSGVTAIEDPAGGSAASATVENLSPVPQRSLVVYAVARRRGRVVAAGRALVPDVPAGGSAPLQVYFVGEAKGASLELRAPATTIA